MHGLFKALFLTPLLLLCSVLHGQEGSLLKNFLTVDNGLSHNEVTSIVQDHDGFMWIGTRGGLNRYDGYEFKIFNQVPGDSNSLVNPSVESLFVDKNGNIWIGTKSGGVSKYNPNTGVFSNIVSNYKKMSPLLNSNRILSFFEDKSGRIWMGTWGSGLIIYDPATKTSQNFLNGTISSIVASSDNRVWVGGNRGVYEFNVDNFTHKEHSDVGGCQKICYDSKRNVLWVVGGNKGFRKYNLRNNRLNTYPIRNSLGAISFSPRNLESLLLDKQNRIWVGTWGNGLYLFDEKTESFERYMVHPENRRTSNKDYDTVLEMFQDRDDNIWIGTNGGGICHLTSKLSFNSIGAGQESGKGLGNTRIMSVAADERGRLWMGSIGSGLFWSPDRKNVFPVEYPSSVNPSRFFVIKSLYKDSKGIIWIGGGGNTGIFFIRFENGKPKMISAPNHFKEAGLKIQTVSFLDDDSTFFAGSLQNGLYVFDKDNKYRLLKHLSNENGSGGEMKSNRISYLLKDSKKRIWAGTYNGLHVFNRKDTTLQLAEEVFRIKGEFSGNIITCIDEDQRGNIWVGTPNGLNRLIEDEAGEGNFSVQVYTAEDGLASNFIKGISHDFEGNIWISTNVGISKLVSGQEIQFVNFDNIDGVLGKNFTEASVYKNERAGEIFFGGTDGLTWFRPDDIKIQNKSTDVIFTGLSILNKPIDIGKEYDSRIILEKAISQTDEIELTYQQNKIEIQFSALDYASNGKNRYKVLLENHDNEWNNIGTRRFVIYNNLKPGKYKLYVKASSRHNVWNEEATVLQIEVKPPIWQTWYALLFYILVITGIVSIIRWNAIKQVRLTNSLEMEKLQHEQDVRLNEMKLRFFTNLSHEFRTPLTLILAPVKELLAKKEQYSLSKDVQSKISVVQNNSNRLLKLVNQLLDFRKVESGGMKLHASETNLEELVAEICHPFFELARINNLHFNLDVSITAKNIWIDRDKLEVILNNLITNAFKFVKEKGRVEVNLFEEEDVVLLSVSDNGEGIPDTEMANIFDRFYRVGNANGYGSTGIGLALVKRYVEMHKGSISVVSKPQKHTEFTVSIPKGKEHLHEDQIVTAKISEHRNSNWNQVFTKVVPSEEKKLIRSGESILVVEDNEEIREYLRSILTPLYEVFEAENGVEGFNLAKGEKINLIVSDVMMPKMDGFELCKKLRDEESTATIPFIFLTAKSDDQFKLLGTQLGADDFISKPFDPNLLLEKVKNILERNRKLQKQYSKSVRLGPSEVEITSGDEIFIEKLILTIENNLQNHKFTSEVLASEMNMSNSSLYRKLKSLTGSSTAEFIRSIRIKRAAQLLADKQRTITEIAYEVGFNDVKHFRTVFQKNFSCSPSEYREKL